MRGETGRGEEKSKNREEERREAREGKGRGRRERRGLLKGVGDRRVREGGGGRPAGQ